MMIQEEKYSNLFFGMSRLVVTNFGNRYTDNISKVRIVNNSAITKSALTDEEVAKALDLPPNEVRTLVVAAEANFVVWYNGGAPHINNDSGSSRSSQEHAPLFSGRNSPPNPSLLSSHSIVGVSPNTMKMRALACTTRSYGGEISGAE